MPATETPDPRSTPGGTAARTNGGPRAAAPERLLTGEDARAYRRFLEWSVGAGFKLAMVQISEPWRRDALVAWTAATVPGTRVLHLDKASDEPLRTLLEQAAGPPGEMSLLVLTRLEEASDRRRVCAQLNVQRDDLARLFPVPWVVVVHPHASLEMQRDAPDFSDFAGLWVGDNAAAETAMVLPPAAESQALDIGTPMEVNRDVPGSDLLAKADAAIRAGKVDEARDLLAQHGLVHPEESESADRELVEGRLSFHMGDLGRARKKLTSVLRSCEQGRDELGSAIALGELGSVLHALGDYEEAERMLEQALAIRAKAAGPEHPIDGASLSTLAAVLKAQGKYVEAEALARRALVLREKVLGVDHSDYSITLHVLADILDKQGKYSEAERLLRQALTIDERTLSAGSANYGASLNNLAGMLAEQGKYDQAESLLRKAIAIQERALGVEHLSYGASLSNLASVAQAQGRYQEAERLIRQAVAIQANVLGHDHPDYGASLHILAHVLHEQGISQEAEELLWRSLRIKERALGKTHPDLNPTLTNLAVILAEQGRPAEAESLLQRALQIAEQGLGGRHPDTARVLNILAQLQFHLANPEAKDTA